MQRPSVDLPHPDSPTRPIVSPSATENVTSSTAWTRATSRPRTPLRIGKYLRRCRTSSSGAEPFAVGRAVEAATLVVTPLPPPPP